jgi:8-oxo-dGTP pyrophosphatase MutT (NUDIX family)
VLPVAEHDGEVYALLQMRSPQHRTNAGKVSLIGGNKAASDACSRATAVRECFEEAGFTLDPEALVAVTATNRVDIFAVLVTPSSLDIAAAPDVRELGDAAPMASARTLAPPEGWREPLGHAWIARTDLARLSDACTLVANTVEYAIAAMDALALADTAPVSSDHLNEIWRPPGSKTAAAVYVGSQKAVADVEILKRIGITHIVNCKSRGPKQRHPGIEYCQFPIQQWKQHVDDQANAQEFFAPVMQFIQAAIDAGGGCLIHCERGKHRAGTTGVAWLMHAEELSSAEATKLAQQRRPVIDPSAEYDLQALLELLDKAQTDPNYYEQILDGLRYPDPSTAAADAPTTATSAEQSEPESST